MDFSLGYDVLAILFAVALVAGFLDAMAGGGGLITIPALLLSGIPPLLALATNKMQASSGSLTATLTMIRMGMLRPVDVAWPFVAALAGSVVGTIALHFIDAKALDIIIPSVLIGIALYFALAPRAGDVDGKPRIGRLAYRLFVVPAIGLYDGMFGPGTGSFFALAGVTLRGQNLVRATAHAKAMNFASNLASVGVFIFSGKILWAIALTMMCGQVIGASLGSIAVVKGESKYIRPLIVTMCVIMIGRYFWQYFR